MAVNDDDVVTNVRLPRDWLERADALVASLEGDESVRSIARPTRSTVLRIAVLEGIRVLELKYGQPSQDPRPKGKKK